MKRFVSIFSSITLTLAALSAVMFWSGIPAQYAVAAESRTLSASFADDPGSLIDAAGESQAVTVTGAALGDFCLASYGVSTAGITVTCNVTSAGVATVRYQNETAGTLDLAASTLRVMVWKRPPP